VEGKLTEARILIGMPAFQGADVIREALQSIAEQDHSNFRVLISVDGGDSDTAVACREFLADPRFSLVIQPHRLGWAGNINWLMSQPDYDFFCFWQHDDYATSNYISELLAKSTSHGDSVCYFSRIQWFGLHDHLTIAPSVTGLAVNRSLSIFETLNGVPFRGLIRKTAIDRIGPIRLTNFDSAFEEFIWVGKLAREGNLQYADAPVYFKRGYADSTHAKYHRKDRLWKRAVWLEFGLGMLETIWPLVPEDERVTALAIVLDRLCIAKEGRFLFYEGPTIPFASDFIRKTLQQFSLPAIEESCRGHSSESFVGGIAGELLDKAILWLRRGQTQNELHEQSRFDFRFGERGIDLLITGWSIAENWGIWSDGPLATLRLPTSGRCGTWRATVAFTTFGKQGTKVTVSVVDDSESLSTIWSVPANQSVQKQLDFESRRTDVVLQFSFPKVLSPFQLGISADRRLLGMGLISLSLDRLS
jgi:glycosyltransferase involved in cell wall biosynthesis